MALLATLAGGCYGPGGEAEEADVEVSALNGTVNFVLSPASMRCSSPEVELIGQAMNIAQRQVLGSQRPAMYQCLEGAVFSPAEDAIVEEIITRLSQNMPTTISCEDFDGNASTSSTTSERFRFSHRFLKDDFSDAPNAPPPTAARVASVMLHEIAHTKGYSHFWGYEGAEGVTDHRASTEYAYSVPEQVERCSTSLSDGTARPNGQRRSAMRGEVELQPVGGGNGLPFEALCPADRGAVYGISVATTPGEVSTLSLFCRASLSGAEGAVGGPLGPGTAVRRDCPPGQVVVGVAGAMSMTNVGSLSPLCADDARVRANLSYTAQATPPPVSVNGMHAFTRQCPQGMVMRGVYGRTDNLSLDQIRVVCQQPGLSALPAAFPMLPMGTGPTDVVRRDFCTDQGAMTGLHGLFTAQRISRFGGICRGLARDTTSQRWTIRSTEDHVTPGRGVFSGEGYAFNEQWTAATADDQRYRCPTGQVLVGVAVRLGAVGEVASLAGQCASVDAWNSAAASPLSFTTVFGRSVATSSLDVVRTCPRRHYLAGLETARGTSSTITGVTRVTPFCRWFPNP